MTNHHRLQNRLVVALFLVFLPSGIAAIPEALVDNRPICAQADEWVEAHAGALPASYRDLKPFPVEYQRRIFSRLPNSTKSAVWTERIRDVSSRLSLTQEQHAIVADLIKLATPGLWESRNVDTTILARAEQHFVTDDVRRMLFELSDTPDGTVSIRTLPILFGRAISGIGAVLALPNCQCNSGYELCCPFTPTGPPPCGQYCCCHATLCIEKPTGCGFLWSEQCDGWCQPNPCGY